MNYWAEVHNLHFQEIWRNQLVMTINKLHLKFQLNTAINKNIFITKNVLNPGVHTSCYKNTIKSWWIKMQWPPSEVHRFDLHMITSFLRVTKCCRWLSNCPTLIPKIRQYNQNWTGLKIRSRIIPREVFKTIIREHPSPQFLTRFCFPESSPFLSPTQWLIHAHNLGSSVPLTLIF